MRSKRIELTNYSTVPDINKNFPKAFKVRRQILGVGFEPTKHNASDLKSDPFDQTRVTQLLGGGFEPPKHNAPDLKSGPFNQTRES